MPYKCFCQNVEDFIKRLCFISYLKKIKKFCVKYCHLFDIAIANILCHWFAGGGGNVQFSITLAQKLRWIWPMAWFMLDFESVSLSGMHP